MSQTQPDTNIWVETLVSHRTGQPLVQIAWYDHTGQLTPAEARDLARNLLDAASIAEADAGLVRFLKERVGLEHNAAGTMLNELREYRRVWEQEEGAA